jgi:hypothetical protein
MELGMYIMAPQSTSTVYFINPSHQSVCLYVCPLSLIGKGSVKRFHGNKYTHNKRKYAVGVVLYAVRVVSKESRRLVLPGTFCFHFGTAWRSSRSENTEAPVLPKITGR